MAKKNQTPGKKSAQAPGGYGQGPSVFEVLKPYRPYVWLLAAFSIGANALTLWLPKIISHAIDAFARHDLVLSDVTWLFGGVSVAILILTFLQNISQVYVSEMVARDLRVKLAGAISRQSNAYVQKVDPSTLLTNLTSDMDAVKLFVAQAVSSLISSAFLIVGASTLLLLADWRLALAVLTIVPVIGITFFMTLRKVRSLFLQSREVIDRLNRSINESILGAGLIRVLNSHSEEEGKFSGANAASRNLGMRIVGIFSSLIPAITFIASLATIVILSLGGHYILNDTLSFGDYASFSTYLGILIFPILVLGFMSNIIAQATASYGRIAAVLHAEEPRQAGVLDATLQGNVRVEGLLLTSGGKTTLKDVTFEVKQGSRTAIIGPTAAGKTQLLYALTGLLEPTAGTILFDGKPAPEYSAEALHRQIGFVFQDSIIFSMSLRENIAFSQDIDQKLLDKAIQTAELSDLIDVLPDGLETMVSERGTSLSGGQKQRLMLARALALNPKILLLDDFTARVDTATETKILGNLRANYPDLTLISVTQKVAPIMDYDQILLLMEGELLASGTHKQLLKSSPEYVQIYQSQASTTEYELHA